MAEPTHSPQGPVAVVGIGGSAGALDGYERFFLSLPPQSGMAFVVVPHLDPRHRGLMPELLQRCTDLPVEAITDGLQVQADHVYVLPPGSGLSIMNGVLLLEDLGRTEGGLGQVIDRFFEALAADQGRRAVGVVLSGMGSDGTQGIQAIKEHFGIVLVQDPRTAEYPMMPRSAVSTQLANSVLPAEELAAQLYALVTRSHAASPGDLLGADGQPGAPMQKVLRLVRMRTGHDFTQYKRSTLVRRIDRRMKAHRLEDITQYIRLLQDNTDEVDALFRDFTINVTSFFRDTEAFDELKDQLRQYILTVKQDIDQFRVWVAGCSTGEEAYSVCIALHELMDELREVRVFKVQVFATDIDKEALERARYGLYPADIAYVVSSERLERFFQPKDDGYQVRPDIRDSIIFAQHSTFGDPPFTRLDLLCCRNMLIYLGTQLQRQILTVFHYALHPGGLLFLGASETTGHERDRFTLLSTRWKIYRRGEGTSGPLPLPFTPDQGSLPLLPEATFLPSPRSPRVNDVGQQAQRLLLSQYTPPAVVVNAAGDILYVNGRTARYLELPPGKLLVNIFEMVQEELRYELPAALRQASAERAEIVRRNLRLTAGGGLVLLDLTVRPMPQTQDPQFLIVFQEHGESPEQAAAPEQSDRLQVLERELQHSKEILQATIEQMGVSLEELKSTNEELQTTNEELQSSNEELTTSKEELQSLNEELVTINAEHQRVIHDLAQANDDMKNLLESAGIATVFLGNDLRIKRFTPRITRVINLMPVDIGRPITDISVNLNYEYLTRDIARVLDTLETYEAQVQTQDGQWYLMRVSPYRTSDNFIDGVVLAFTNINVVKALEAQVRESMEYAEAVLNSMQDPLLVLDRQLRIITANRTFYDLMYLTPAQVRSELLYTVANFVFDQPDLQRRLRELVTTDEVVSNYVIDLKVPQQGVRKMKVEAEAVDTKNADQPMFLFKMEDVTELLLRAAQDGSDLIGDARPGS
ncbi:CheR family methyltransferase [Deinococcus sp. Leaf326]|uniref:CheR family methyltransferase n=1 Tax=Deinococcus sp. Leaf326 TaxID=1736338 RepID=UPI0006F75F9E|nr:CheR family methyltransferase [Deinococcus sp. Leaf326]KQR22999.1 chemotaxis protein [Deinococcus sp. Leaf326]